MMDLLTATEAAAALGIKRSTLLRLDREGKIQSERTSGNHRRYKISTINVIKAKREGKSTTISTRSLKPSPFLDDIENGIREKLREKKLQRGNKWNY